MFSTTCICPGFHSEKTVVCVLYKLLFKYFLSPNVFKIWTQIWWFGSKQKFKYYSALRLVHGTSWVHLDDLPGCGLNRRTLNINIVWDFKFLEHSVDSVIMWRFVFYTVFKGTHRSFTHVQITWSFGPRHAFWHSLLFWKAGGPL